MNVAVEFQVEHKALAGAFFADGDLADESVYRFFAGYRVLQNKFDIAADLFQLSLKLTFPDFGIFQYSDSVFQLSDFLLMRGIPLFIPIGGHATVFIQD
ncbi:MAG: hypothetical protein ACLUUL_06730 [Gemmiger sp.]